MVEKILFVLVVFVSNVIQAITGFAGTMLAMPASMLLIGVTEAKVILNLVGLLVCLQLTIKNYKNINKHEFIKITVLMLVGMVVGIYLFKIAPITILLKFYAILIIAISLKKIFIKKEIHIPKMLMIGVILMAGIVHGMFVSGGSLLVVYAVTVLKDKSEFRATMSPIWVILNSILLFTHVNSGYFTKEITVLSAVVIVPVFLSIMVGNFLYTKINQKVFLMMTYLLLLASGILILV